MNNDIEINTEEAYARSKEGSLFLDVRERHEIDEQSFDVPSLMIMPLSEFESSYTRIPVNRDVIVVCQGGGRSLQVTRFLRAHGHPAVTNLQGGIDRWSKHGFPTKGKQAAGCCAPGAKTTGCCSPPGGPACCD
mgnify:CR=1 FL=1